MVAEERQREQKELAHFTANLLKKFHRHGSFVLSS